MAKAIRSQKQHLVEDNPSKFGMDYSKITTKELSLFKESNDEELIKLEREIISLKRAITRLEFQNRNISIKALRAKDISSLEQVATSEDAFEYTVGNEHFFSTSNVLTQDEQMIKMDNNKEIIEHENKIMKNQKLISLIRNETNFIIKLINSRSNM